MNDIEYTTTGGITRVIKNLTRLENNYSNTATRWASEDGKKTYEWFWQGAVDGRLQDDVLRVTSRKSCSRFLGTQARYVS